MHAIILAAGQGNRLSGFNPDARPKCLLEFGGKSLLARQLDSLFLCGVKQVTLVVGYEADQIIDHVGTSSSRPEVAFVYNPAYSDGSVLSLLAAQDTLNDGATVLVMDADVLFHPQIMQALIESTHENCFLIDRGLYDLSLWAARVQSVDLRFVPTNINITPDDEHLLLREGAATMWVFSIADQALVHSMRVPVSR